MRTLKVLAVITLIALACELPSITVSLGQPTPTPTLTATATLNAQATADAQATTRAQAEATTQAQTTATAQAQATATAQAQATANALATANAQATGTAQAQATSTAQAQATTTAQAQATAQAKAQATATTQALIAAINALDKNAKRSFLEKEGKLGGYDATKIHTFFADFRPRNFVAEVRFYNPADPAIHPWDYGFGFRRVRSNEDYRLIFYSNKTWQHQMPIRNLADAVEVKVVTRGTVPNLDVSPTGSNQIRLVVKDALAYFFVNGEYIAAVDVSERNGDGDLYIGTGFTQGDSFPGLSVRFTDFSAGGMP